MIQVSAIFLSLEIVPRRQTGHASTTLLLTSLSFTEDYSKREGGALGLVTGPTAAQAWFIDPHPALVEFLSRPH